MVGLLQAVIICLCSLLVREAGILCRDILLPTVLSICWGTSLCEVLGQQGNVHWNAARLKCTAPVLFGAVHAVFGLLRLGLVHSTFFSSSTSTLSLSDFTFCVSKGSTVRKVLDQCCHNGCRRKCNGWSPGSRSVLKTVAGNMQQRFVVPSTWWNQAPYLAVFWVPHTLRLFILLRNFLNCLCSLAWRVCCFL